eukprot:c25637_g1_i1 orf=28-2301(+)
MDVRGCINLWSPLCSGSHPPPTHANGTHVLSRRPGSMAFPPGLCHKLRTQPNTGGASCSKTTRVQNYGKLLLLPFGKTGRDEELKNEGFKDGDSDWEVDLLDEIYPFGFGTPRRLGSEESTYANVHEEHNNHTDWAKRARRRAVRLLEERYPGIAEQKSFTQRKSRKGSSKRGRSVNSLNGNIPVGKAEVHLAERMTKSLVKRKETVTNVDGISFQAKAAGDVNVVRLQVQLRSERESRMDREFRREQQDYNRRLVEAGDAQEVLAIIGNAIEAFYLRGLPSILSPVNAATALHRIARHMENSNMQISDRLAFARKSELAELVRLAVEVLPSCSAQGLSNIAWALAKVGGRSLYWLEMDRIAEVAKLRMNEFNAQNIANMAGAYASMKHSVPSLFFELACHAARIAEDFSHQELAQFLWAFASMCQPAHPLLDALDCVCHGLVRKKEEIDIIKTRKCREGNGFTGKEIGSSGFGSIIRVKLEQTCSMESGNGLNSSTIGVQDRSGTLSTEQKNISGEHRVGSRQGKVSGKMEAALQRALFVTSNVEEVRATSNPFMNATLGQLANIAWSYAVFNELSRPSFVHVWQTLMSIRPSVDDATRSDHSGAFVRYMSQVYQTNLSLQLEYPHLGLTLGGSLAKLVADTWDRQKSDGITSSINQKEVERLLITTGHNWVAESTVAEYSLDVALVERRLGIEIDGPTHFTRNTGDALGHTTLKRRLLAKAGWTILSIAYQEWEELDGEAEQVKFLKNLLRDYLR